MRTACRSRWLDAPPKYFTVTGDQWPGTPNVLRQTDGLADTVVKLLDEEAAQQPNSSKKRDLDDIIKNGRYELFKKGKDGKEDRSRAVWWVINELIRRAPTRGDTSDTSSPEVSREKPASDKEYGHLGHLGHLFFI